jgi:hypothetical protein
MDVFYFLNERTELARHFYDTASAPMLETKRLIKAGETPFNSPPYDESGEPPYLQVWLRADVELELVGRAAVSMVSEAMKQFFVSWERRMFSGGRPCQKHFSKAFADGFLSGYSACFGDAFVMDWKSCPARLDIVEQVILARNAAQHGDLLVDHIVHDEKTLSKYERPFFIRADEVMFDDGTSNRFLSPSLHITRESLFEAISQVEILGRWVQEKIEQWTLASHGGWQ